MIIRLIQILCPQRHRVMATPYAPEEGWPADRAMSLLHKIFDEVCSYTGNRSCRVCGSTDLVFEDQLTPFTRWEEAMQAFEEQARQQGLEE